MKISSKRTLKLRTSLKLFVSLLQAPRAEVVLVLSRSRSVTPATDYCYDRSDYPTYNYINSGRPPKILESPLDSKSLLSGSQSNCFSFKSFYGAILSLSMKIVLISLLYMYLLQTYCVVQSWSFFRVLFVYWIFILACVTFSIYYNLKQNKTSFSMFESNLWCASVFISDLKFIDAPRGPPFTVILKKEGTGLGFSLEGGKDSPLGDRPLTIKKIFAGNCLTAFERTCFIVTGEILLIL